MVSFRRRLLILILAALFLAACAPSDQSYQPYVPSVGDAAATYQAAVAIATGTAAAATQVASAATGQAQAVSDSATAQAYAVAQATAEAAAATAESQSVRATDMALVVNATGTAVTQQLQAQGTTIALERIAGAATQEARNLEVERADLAAHLRNERRRQEIVNNIIAGSAALFGAAAIVALAVGAFVAVKRYGRPQVQKVTENGREVVLVDGGGGRLMVLPGSSRLMLGAGDEPPAEPSPPLLLPEPRWQAFMRWQNAALIPIGVSAQTGKPIFIDRNKEPHLAIVGTTGSGKTTSGLIPFSTAMWGAGLHVVVANGRGADFNPFSGRQNITLLPDAGREDTPAMLNRFLAAVVAEVDRRNEVLRRYGVRSWHQLPATAGEYGEIVVVVDEFLAVIAAAEAMADSPDRTTDERRYLRGVVAEMWRNLQVVTAEARKFGIYLVVTMTDPTREVIGSRGMAVRRQMARMAFGMKSAASSRMILDCGSSTGFPNGSVGLETGQFIANVMGRIEHGVAFHPSLSDLDAYFNGREVAPNPLPDGILEAVQEDGAVDVWSVPQTAEALASGHLQAAEDGQSLSIVIAHCRSLTDVGVHLYGVESARSVSGQMLDERVKPALQWRIDNLNCPHSLRLMNRIRS